MGHSMDGMMSKKRFVIAAVLLVSVLIAVYGFNVSWGTLAPIAFLSFFVWMHMGGHSMHGGSHGREGDDAPRDEHAGHAPAPAGDSDERALALDADARPLASGTDVASVVPEAPRRSGRC